MFSTLIFVFLGKKIYRDAVALKSKRGYTRHFKNLIRVLSQFIGEAWEGLNMLFLKS